MSRTLNISPEAWERAKAKAAELETTLFEFFRTGMTGQGKVLADMGDAVKSAGLGGMLLTDFANRYKNIPNWRQLRDTLKETGVVLETDGPKPEGRGRPPRILIHRDFVRD